MKIPAAVTALLDTHRLAVAGALVDRHRTTAEVAEHTGLDATAVVRAIGALRQAGLVDAIDDGRYTLTAASLHELASGLEDADIPMDPVIGFGMSDTEAEILSRFFQGRTLAEIPTNRAKRLIVLERLALEFDLGKRYAEAEVNRLLRGFHPDVSSLRRHLIDEEFLDRADGEYWRSGGRG